ncbi:hypothetical protein P7C71_g2381, partial [Lecanoromycetidae sp. Uapishka_2]
MAGKRKRQDTLEDIDGQEVDGKRESKQQDQFHEWLIDVMEILREHDTTPSSFYQPISSAVPLSHDQKRAKVSEPQEERTIAGLVAGRGYMTVEDFVQDVDTATCGVIEGLKTSNSSDSISQKDLRDARIEVSKVTSLKEELDDLIRVEMIRRPNIVKPLRDIKTESSEERNENARTEDSGDNVLTLFGQADPRSAKQLFSSIRKYDEAHQPLAELPLPNGITTTKIVPQHSLNEGEKPPTLKDLFPPPVTLASLPVPKASKHTTTRSSSVNWYSPAEAEARSKSGRRDNYPTQALSTGQWLTYNVAPSPTQLASPESKRKQRDRALSFGEPQNALSAEAAVAHSQAKEDALFRSVYSTFAPDRDDSGALVAEQQKNRLWWKKYGESRYEELLGARDAMINGSDSQDTDGLVGGEEINEEELQEAIKNWQPEETLQHERLPHFSDKEVPGTDKDVDGLLQEISDLLETLDSHQRVRNLTLASKTGAIVASPASPSAAEFDVYETLKAQLTLIISSLPPYLLAKIDGDRLGALKISTKIQVESRNQRGTMEEGEASAAARTARLAAPATASTPNTYAATPARSSSYAQPTATPVPQYPRAGYGSSTAPKPVNPSYLQNPPYSNRPASSNYTSTTARPSYGPQGGYAPQQNAASASRYNYGQAYGQQQQSQSQYGAYQNGYRPYGGQNSSSYNYNSQYSTPQARTGPQASQYRGSQTEYPQRAVPPQGYGYGSAQAGGSSSPQVHPRPSYTGQAQSQTQDQQRPHLYHQHSSSYQSQSQPPASPQVNGAVTSASGSPAQQGHLSASEQAALMERQKAQLAERNHSQSRQASGTPQPVNAGQNGTPAPQQNGITA